MRHWAIAAGVAIGVAFGVSLGTVAWPIDPGRVQRDFAVAFGRLEAPTRATFTLLPRPTLRIEGVQAAGAGGVFTAHADRGRGDAAAGPAADRRVLAAYADFAGRRGAHRRRGGQSGVPAARPAAAERGWCCRAPRSISSRPILPWRGVSTSPRRASTGLPRRRRFGATARGAGARSRSTSRANSTRRSRSRRGGASAMRAAVDAPLAQLRFCRRLVAGRERRRAVSRPGSALIPSLDAFRALDRREPPPGYLPPGLELQARRQRRLRPVQARRR